MELSAPDRQALAARLGLNEQYLYQCLTGRKDMRTDEAVRVERDSGNQLRRWHLRSNDWWLHWPELIDTDGAPSVPPTAAEGGAGGSREGVSHE